MVTGRASLIELLGGRPLVIASNRGPVAYEKDSSGNFIARKGAGGLVTALSHVMSQASGVWIASAMTAADKEVVKTSGNQHLKEEFDAKKLELRYLLFSREVFDQYYHRISNQIFWFMQHSLWNLPIQPQFTRETYQAWDAYAEVNRGFAQAIAEELEGPASGAPVMLHDYHLMVAGDYLRQINPDAFCYHFTHSPWTHPEGMRMLPPRIARETLEGMLANDLLGFQSSRWAHNFMECCQDILEAKVDYRRGRVVHAERETRVRYYPISIDVDAIRSSAASSEAEDHAKWLRHSIGDRKLIIRVDRMELSKNIVRGLKSYARFLLNYPEWKGKVVHLALLYPSRRALPEYRSYEAEVFALHDDINSQFGTDDWTPIILINEDNYVRALSCLRFYDVLIVNPLFDGMNLVAKEGPAVNENDGVLILSTNAGAWAEMSMGALSVNPFDISELADAINVALSMDQEERQSRSAILKQVVERNTPSKWVWHQLHDIKRLNSKS